MDKFRVVFDCNVYLQALINPGGPAGRCLTYALARQALLWASPYVFHELRRVAAYPELAAQFPHVTAEHVANLIGEIEKAATVIRKVPPRFSYPRDPDDAPYIDLAVAANASRLVTRDRDLHDLTVDHSLEAKQFRQLTRNQLRIVTPNVFAEEMRASLGDALNG